MTGSERMGGEGEGRGIEWVRRGRTSCWEESNGFSHRRRRESEGNESRDEKIMMVKLIA
jgi:hypothetical protein